MKEDGKKKLFWWIRPVFTIGIVLSVVVSIAVLSKIYGTGITCSDLLLYVGSAIGGVAALIAIVVSSHHTSMAYQQNERYHQRSQMPFLVVEPIEIVGYHFSVYKGKDGDEKLSGYDKWIIIDAGDLNPVLSEDIKRYIRIPLLFGSEYYLRKMIVRNIGADSAYGINIKIQNQDVVVGWSLAKNEDIVLFLIIHMSHGGSDSENYLIDVNIEYCDLEGRRYCQNCSCEVNHRPSARVLTPKNLPPKFLN